MKKLYEENDVKNLAGAIRKKNGSSDKYKLSDMKCKIMQFPSMKTYKRPDVYNEEKAMEVQEVMASYIPPYSGGEHIKYKAGYSVMDGVFKDENDEYIIHCSGLVSLILRGIPFIESPYYSDESDRIKARCDLYSWADSYLDVNNIRTSNEIFEYMYKCGYVLPDTNDLKIGDVLFYVKDDVEVTGGVWHVAMVYDITEIGVTCIHALYGKEDGVWVYKHGSLDNLKLGYVARPDYTKIYEVVTTDFMITAQPTDQTGKVGDVVTFKVEATGEGLTYKWVYRNNNIGNWYDSTYEGSNTDTQQVEVQSWRNNQHYKCVITDINGNTIESDVVKITMIS